MGECVSVTENCRRCQQIAQDKLYRSLDLRSAYHQVPLLESERQYTSFEPGSKLHQSKRSPFDATSSVPAFHRVMDEFVRDNHLCKVCAYLDDITVTGSTLEEHDRNLKKLLEVSRRQNLTLNAERFKLSHNQIKPDPQWLQPLIDLPAPRTATELKRVLEMFAHYAC